MDKRTFTRELTSIRNQIEFMRRTNDMQDIATETQEQLRDRLFVLNHHLKNVIKHIDERGLPYVFNNDTGSYQKKEV